MLDGYRGNRSLRLVTLSFCGCQGYRDAGKCDSLSSALQVSSALREGRISPTQLCRKCLNQIRNTQHLNAYISVTEELALRQAQEAESRLMLGGEGPQASPYLHLSSYLLLSSSP